MLVRLALRSITRAECCVCVRGNAVKNNQEKVGESNALVTARVMFTCGCPLVLSLYEEQELQEQQNFCMMAQHN